MDRGNLRQYLAAFIAAMSMMMVGTSYGWINPLLPRLLAIKDPPLITADQMSWIVAFIELGDLFSPIPAARLCDLYGRKTLLLSTAPIYIISWILVLTTRSVSALYFVRFLQGIGMGISYTVLPLYLAEIAHPKIRGAISSFFEIMWCIGILFEYLLGPYVSYQQLGYVSLSVPVVFVCAFSFMPETPYYLVMAGENHKAYKALSWLRGDDCPRDEMAQIKDSVSKDIKMESRSWKDLIATAVDRRAFIIVQVTAATANLSGIGSVLSYSSDTFSKTNSSFLTPDQFTLVMGFLILLSTLVTTYFVDRAGRRPLALISSFGCAIAQLSTALYYYLADHTSVDLTSYGWVAFVTISAYCVIFNFGIGPVVPILQAELFPSSTRGMASGITSITDTISALFCMKLYEVIASRYGVYLNYFMYSGFCFVGFFTLYFILPETKGRSFAQIQSDLIDSLNESQSFSDKEVRRKRSRSYTNL